MPDAGRRAVITGLGVVTPLGQDLDTFWAALRAGTSGVRRLRNLDTSGLPVHIGGEIEEFDPKQYLDKKDRKRLPVMVRTFQFAVAAARLAIQGADITPENTERTRLATVFGSATIPSELADLGRAARATANCQPMCVNLQKWGSEGLPLIPPMWMLCHIPNMVGCHVSIVHDAEGPSNTVTQTDTAGLLALGEGWRMIRHDKADVAVVGSADTKLNFINLVRQSLFAPLSREERPERACRPFDRRRDGIILGEGGGVLILEDLEHARRRGATIYAEVLGFSSTLDRSARRGSSSPIGVPRERMRPYPPRGGLNGLVRAIRQALNQAGIRPDDLDHVNAQGYSTIADDVWEAQSLHQVLEGAAIPVFAAKSYFGSLGAGGGSVELAASILAMHHGLLPATLNYEEPDPACPVTIARAPLPIRRPYFLKIAFSELGQVAAVVCRRWTE